MNKNTRYGVLLVVAISLAGLAYFAYNANRQPAALPTAAPAGAAPGKPGGGGPAAGMPVAVEVARVVASDFVDEVAAVGSLKSNESVILRPEMAGRVAAIQFRDGAVVGKGSELIRLDGAIQEAELQQARANLALAQTNFQRSQELLERKFISQQALDSAAATLKVQQAAVQLAEARLAKTRVRAPFAGALGLRNISVGDYVKEGQDLINLEDIRTLRVDFRLPETYLARVAKGQSVELRSDAMPGQSFSAVLDAVDPQVDPSGRSLSVRARLDNAAGKLRPGMFVRVRLVFGERKGALMLPEQAIVPGGQPAVFKVVEGKAKLTKVGLGTRRAAQVEVLSGLDSGDQVVTAGQLKLRDGAAVKPIGEGAPPPLQPPVDMIGMAAGNRGPEGMGGMSGMYGAAGMAGPSGMAAAK